VVPQSQSQEVIRYPPAPPPPPTITMPSLVGRKLVSRFALITEVRSGDSSVDPLVVHEIVAGILIIFFAASLFSLNKAGSNIPA
jgi:hypothetical protein